MEADGGRESEEGGSVPPEQRQPDMSVEARVQALVATGRNEAVGPEAEDLVDDELEDLAEEPSQGLREAGVAALRSPLVQRAVIGIGIAIAVLAWPQRSDRILARLIGLGLVLLFASALAAAVRQRPRRIGDIVLALAAIIVGAVLLLLPTGSEVLLGRVIGAVIAARALNRIAGQWLSRRVRSTLLLDLVLLVAAAFLIAFPAETLAALTTVAAAMWILFGVAVIAITVERGTDAADDSPSGLIDAGQLIGEWLAGRSKSVEDRGSIIAKVLFDGHDVKRRYVRFFTLMASAAVIASMGVITDSTAVVIGAMLIAPLMTPLMGMAMSLVMGWPRRLARSTIVALGGIAIAIAIGFLLGVLLPATIDPATNAQIISRSSPTTLDLVVALAAGTAGAYGLSRPDVSDSLPGVAIAISLVPPLAVVGISLSQGSFDAASGSLLLFATNMVAILIMGGVAFVVTGVTPLHRVAGQQHRMRTSLAAVAGLALIVVGALFLNGATIAANALQLSEVESSVETWLEEHPQYQLNSLRFDDDIVVVVITGPGQQSPTARSLADHLSADLDEPVTVTLNHVVVESSTAGSG